MKSQCRFIILVIIVIYITAHTSVVLASDKNLCISAVLYGSSGFINDEEQDIFAFDGNIDTKWCATYDNIIMSDETRDVFELGFIHWLAIDLGEPHYFDSYKLIHASLGIRDLGVYAYNAVAWAIQTSDDGKNWTTISEFYDNYEETTEVFIGTRYARYVRLMISQPEASGGSTVRLPEFELYECAEGEPVTGIIGELQSEDERADEAGTVPESDMIIEGIIPEKAGDLTESETGTQITGIHIAGIIITAIATLGVGTVAFCGIKKREPA
ncbi:MAG: discoidin domain-containing protein [Eubacteriales bacterium]